MLLHMWTLKSLEKYLAVFRIGRIRNSKKALAPGVDENENDSYSGCWMVAVARMRMIRVCIECRSWELGTCTILGITDIGQVAPEWDMNAS